MKAFVVDKYKKQGALRLADVPEPEVRDDDVLVRVRATGVNLLDSKIRDGEFKLILPYRPPFVLGHDVAGTVVRVGPKVRRFKVGDEVYARPRDHRVGTFAVAARPSAGEPSWMGLASELAIICRTPARWGSRGMDEVSTGGYRLSGTTAHLPPAARRAESIALWQARKAQGR